MNNLIKALLDVDYGALLSLLPWLVVGTLICIVLILLAKIIGRSSFLNGR
jgi:hypothetical protein